jgi:succinate dehydrogenase/fumarate reductase flavoprotein subunit
MYDYLVAVSPDPDHAKIRAYCEGSVEHFTWLEDLGFRFERSYFPGKAVIQPHTEGLMYTGNEKVWPFCTETAPAPRGHKVPVAGDTGGARMVVDLLLKRAASLGVQIRYETGATGLVRRGGDLVGTTWRRYEESGAVRAGAVVIAAGGFIMNSEMVAHHIPQLKTTPMALGNTYDDGLGIRLGMSAGAAARDMDKVFITAPVYPPGILLTGLIVNNQGHRFVAEDSYHARTSAFVMEQPDSTAFPHRRRSAPADATDAAGASHRRLGDASRHGEGAGNPVRQPMRHPAALQHLRGDGPRPRLSQTAGVPGRTGPRTVGCVRPVPRNGRLFRLHSRWVDHHRGRQGLAC